MRILILSLFFVFLANLAARAAYGAAPSGMTAILSLKKGAEVSQADLQKLMKSREIVKSRDLFLPAEKDILKSIHAEYLAKAWVLEFKNEKSFDAIEKQIRRQGLPLNLDWNDLKVTHQSADPLVGLQWALGNTGVPQAIDLDPMIAYKIQGRVGEDIHAPRLS